MYFQPQCTTLADKRLRTIVTFTYLKVDLSDRLLRLIRSYVTKSGIARSFLYPDEKSRALRIASSNAMGDWPHEARGFRSQPCQRIQMLVMAEALASL